MATTGRSSLTRPVLLVCLVLGLFGAVCYGRVTQHGKNRPNLHRLGSGDRALQGDLRHSRDVSEPSSAKRHWKFLAKRLITALRRMRSNRASDEALPQDITLDRALRALRARVHHQRVVSESPSAKRWETPASRLSAAPRLTKPTKSKPGPGDNQPEEKLNTMRKRRSPEGTARRDDSTSSSATHWKLLAKRLNSVLRMMRSRKFTNVLDGTLSSDVKLNRVRRSDDQGDQLAQEPASVEDHYYDESGEFYSYDDSAEYHSHETEDEDGQAGKNAQQQEIARESEQTDRDAGAPIAEGKLAQEQEIAREVKEIEEQYGPAHQLAQQKEIAREIEDAEIQAGRAEADRRFEQQREIQREIEEVERKAGVPSDAEKLEQEREIAREITYIEEQARKRQEAQEQTVAGDIHAIVDAKLGRKRRPSSPVDVDSSSSSSSDESREASDVSNGADDDSFYDDAFGGDKLLAANPLNGDGDDPAATVDDVTSDVQGQVKDAAPGEEHVHAARSSWQVTVMTVTMCAIVGIVLLVVVGTWYRHLRSLGPGRPEQLLVDDDEQAVYNRTTQPRQVGTYSALK